MTFVRSEQTELIREWCHKHPDIPHMTLGRMIVAAYPQLYKSVESARLAVKRQRGSYTAQGGKTRSRVKDPVPYTGENSNVQFAYRAPKSHADDHVDFIVHGAQRVLRLSDIHYPFHDERALDTAINYGIKFDPTVLLLAGDIVDLPDLSKHPKLDRKAFLEQEMLIIAEELEQFRQAFPKARIIWMEGNHEQRLKKYVMSNAPALFGLPGMDVPGFVCAYGGPQAITRVEWVDDCRTVRTGGMAHLHGHEHRGGGGINPARALYLKTGESTTIGHFHKTQTYIKPLMNGKRVECLVTGCLSTTHPDWMRKTEWNVGFSSFHVDSDGQFEAMNHRIIDGRVR